MIDLLSLSGVYRIEEDPGVPGSEELTWPFDYKVKVTKEDSDRNVYDIANDVTSGGGVMENFVQVRDNQDGTYDLSYDEYGDGNYQYVDGIDEETLMSHLNHLINMEVGVKVSELPEETTVSAEEELTEGRYSGETEKTARELVKRARKDRKNLSFDKAKELVDQSFNPDADDIDSFYSQLTFEEDRKESSSGNLFDGFMEFMEDKISTEEVDFLDVVDDLLSFRGLADQATFREGVDLINQVLREQESLTESRKDPLKEGKEDKSSIDSLLKQLEQEGYDAKLKMGYISVGKWRDGAIAYVTSTDRDYRSDYDVEIINGPDGDENLTAKTRKDLFKILNDKVKKDLFESKKSPAPRRRRRS